MKIDDGWEEFRRKQNKEKASKDEINTKTHNEDKKATRALIATILIISFFLILALIGIYSDESSPNYAENVTDTYNY